MMKPQLHRIVGFHTTADALAFQAACTKRKLPGRLMTIPREVSAGCGLAWRVPIEEAPYLDELIEEERDYIEIVCDIEI